MSKILNVIVLVLIGTSILATTLVDSLGREIDVETPVERVFSDYSLVPPFIYMLGEKDAFLGGYFFGWRFYALIDDGISEKLKYGKKLPIETIISLKPDVYITRFSSLKLREYKQIEDLGIPVMGVNLETIDDINRTVELLGKLFGKEELSKKITDYYRRVYSEVLKRSKDVVKRPKVLVVYYSGKAHALRTFGGDMFQSVLVELAGGESVSKELKDKITINTEQILKWNPDYVFVLQYGKSPEKVKESILSDPVLKGVKAVKSERVFLVPNDGENWIDPCPKWTLGLLWIAKVIHPDIFKDLDLMKEAEYFYREFFNLRLGDVRIKGDGL